MSTVNSGNINYRPPGGSQSYGGVSVNFKPEQKIDFSNGFGGLPQASGTPSADAVSVPGSPAPANYGGSLGEQFAQGMSNAQTTRSRDSLPTNAPAPAPVQAPAQSPAPTPPSAPTMEETNIMLMDQLNQMFEQQRQSIDEQYRLRSDGITQAGLAQMRQAAGLAGLAGQSFGGSFADAQRQVFMNTQGLQNQAYSDMLSAQQGVTADQIARTQSQINADRSFDFTRSEAERQQSNIDRDRQDRLDAQAGDVAAQARTGLTDYSIEMRRNPLEDDAGNPLPYEALDSRAKEFLEGMAVAEGIPVEEYYSQVMGGSFGGTDRFDVNDAQIQRRAVEITAQYPVDDKARRQLENELQEARNSGNADKGDREAYERYFNNAYNSAGAPAGLSREEFSLYYQYPLPESFNIGIPGYTRYG